MAAGAERPIGFVERIAPIAIVAAALVGMLSWTWRTWPDVLIDAGRELYAAWQVSEGRVISRDIAWLSGPLSVEVNALWFRLFGVGLTSLAAANACLFGALLTLLFAISTRIGSRFAATVAAVTATLLSGFGQLTDVGNYNFMTPYSHELTHGVILSFAAIAAFGAFLAAGRFAWLGATGLFLGLVFLTKAEAFTALAAALAVGLTAAIWTGRVPGGRRLAAVALLLVSAAVPVVACLGYLTSLMPAQDAVVATTGAWQHVFDRGLAGQLFYRRMLGLLDPWANLVMVGAVAAAYAGLVGLALTAARLAARWTSNPVVSGGAGFIAGALLVGLGTPLIAWHQAARALPLFMAGLAIAWMTAIVRDRRRVDRRSVLALVVVVFAFVLLLKMVLNTVFFQYGFALALPAVAVLIVALFEWIPALGERRGLDPRAVRGFFLAAWCVLLAVHVGVMSRRLDTKHVDVAAGGADGFRADARGLVVNQALVALESGLTPCHTLVALPEGVMLNYLLRRTSPTRFVTFMPPEVIAFGEDAMVADLSDHPPDCVALVHKDTTEYGMPRFGTDYGARILAWVHERYTPIETFGALPLAGNRFGIQLLRHVAVPPPETVAWLNRATMLQK